MLNICRRNVAWLVLAFLLAWSFGPNAQAQTAEASKKTLTLDEAADFALKHYPAVRADTVWQTNRAMDNNITGLRLPQSVVDAKNEM